MSSGANLFFNLVSTVFVVLTIMVAVVVLSVASGSMDAPVFAPDPTDLPATIAVPPTLTPSPGPGAAQTQEVLTLTPEVTPEAE